MKAFRFFALSAVLVPAMVSCNNPNKEWASNPDNDRVVHICGTIDNSSCKSVRICRDLQDMIHSADGSYYEISVNDGRFSADVPLDSHQVFQFLIPLYESYSAVRVQVFFADQDTIRFAYDAQEDVYLPPELILNPEGSNKEYQDFKEARNNQFANERQSLKEEYSSIAQYYSDEYQAVEGRLNDNTLDRNAKDSVYFILGQMCEDGTAYTPEARQYEEKYELLRKKKLDFAMDYLAARSPSLALLQVVCESIEAASDLDYHYQDWVKYYDREYSDKFPGCNLHQQVSDVMTATRIHQGGHFIDFTLPDKDGHDQTLSQLIEGKYAILEFWATWCHPCITTRHTIKELYERYEDKGFTVVEVAREYRNDAKWRAFIEKDGAGWTDLLAMEENHSVGDAYGLRNAAGATFLIDKDGIVIKVNPTQEEIEAVLGNL
jgi:peroxiredoxin